MRISARPAWIVGPTFLIFTACASATPPTITTDDIAAAEAAQAAADALPATAAVDIPTTGTVAYAGQIGGDIFGDVDGAFLGDLSLSVAFDGGTIDGDVTNINLIDEDGIPDQLLDGALDVDGSISGATTTMQATGALDAVEESGSFGFEGTSDVDFNLVGNFRTDTAPADTMVGTVTGQTTGDWEVTVFDGSYYATQQ